MKLLIYAYKFFFKFSFELGENKIVYLMSVWIFKENK